MPRKKEDIVHVICMNDAIEAVSQKPEIEVRAIMDDMAKKHWKKYYSHSMTQNEYRNQFYWHMRTTKMV